MRRTLLLPILFALLSALAKPAVSQNYLNNWYFGGYAAIDFNTSPAAKILNSAMTTDEGCSSISDPETGELLFYTNGDTVWNRNHQKMPNGIGLGGHRSTTQSAVIVPAPDNPQLYYIFTVYAQANEYFNFLPGSGGLNLNTVDMSLNGGLGDVVIKNQLVLTPTSEKLCAVKQCNGRDYWIVVHKWDSDEYYTYPLTSSGLGAPVISDIGVVHQDAGSGIGWETIGYMRISPDGTKLAMAASRELNRVELFGFDDVTGLVGPLIISDSNYPNICGLTGPYGVCFSPDASKLYVTVNVPACTTEPNQVLQYDLSSGDSATIISSRTVLQSNPSTSSLFAAAQIGPDGKIYVAKVGSLHLDVIENPNAVGLACTYTTNAFLLNVPGSDNTSKYGLPNGVESFFAPRQYFNVSFNSCAQLDTTLFLDTILNKPYTLLWDFGDPASGGNNTSTTQNPFHDFTTPGIYNVTLSIFLPCDTIIVIKSFNTITSIEVNAGPDTTLCVGSSIVMNAVGGYNYQWLPSSGLSCSDCAQPVASPIQSTTYIVNVGSIATGCFASDTIIVNVSPPLNVITSGDVSLCGNGDVQLSVSGASSYHWFPSDGLSATDISNPTVQVTQNVTYTVIGSQTNCISDTQTISIDINAVPTVSAGNDTSVMLGESIQLNAASSTNSFLWMPPQTLSDPTSSSPLASPTTSTTYTVTVTDTNGCTASDTVFVFVEPDDAIVIVPNVFSPNGDGTNDVLSYYTKNVKEMDFKIFNRWGQKIFETNVLNVYWNGTFKNQPQGVGVYVYQAKATSFSGRQIVVSGNFTLMR